MKTDMNRFFRWATLAAAILIAPTLASHGTAAADTLTYATGTDAQTLDPQFVTDVPTSRIVMQIHETLVYPNAEGQIEGVLAESWEVSPDGRTWTFKLRPDVTFHDGSPLTAGAVKATFDRIMAEETGSPRKSAAGSVEQVSVIDDHTVEFVTKSTFAPFLAQLSAYNLAIMSPNAVERIGDDYSREPAGTGPYKLADWIPGETLTLARNEDYWGSKPGISELKVQIVPEDSARVLMLMSGDADVVANVPPAMVEQLKSVPNVEIVQKTGFRTIYLAMNLAMQPFDNPKVRQATALAIDTQALVAGVMQGLATRGGGLESPVIPGATFFDPYPYDPEAAKALLAEAGYPDGFETELYVPTGRYINDKQLGEAIQAQLAEIGIKASIKSPEWGTYQALLREKTTVPLYLIGKGSPTGDLDLTLTLVAGSEGRMNFNNYSDAAVDDAIAKQREIMDVDERTEVLRTILAGIYDDFPYVVLFYEDQLFGQRDVVEGVEILANEFVDFSNARFAQ